MSEQIQSKVKAGCGIAILQTVIQLGIVAPCWLGLLFGILWVINAPGWLWVVFAIYGPAFVISKVLAKVAGNVFKNALTEAKAETVEAKGNERFENARLVRPVPDFK